MNYSEMLLAIDQFGTDMAIFIIGFVIGMLFFRSQRKRYFKAKQVQKQKPFYIKTPLGYKQIGV